MPAQKPYAPSLSSSASSAGYTPFTSWRFPGDGKKGKHWKARLARAMKQSRGMTLSPGEVPELFELLERITETSNSTIMDTLQTLRRVEGYNDQDQVSRAESGAVPTRERNK